MSRYHLTAAARQFLVRDSGNDRNAGYGFKFMGVMNSIAEGLCANGAADAHEGCEQESERKRQWTVRLDRQALHRRRFCD